MLSAGKQSGVTMIELMISVVIVSILLGLAATSYKDWIQNQQIRTAAESILNGLQVTRIEAVKNNANARFVLCGLPISSWEVLAVSAAAAAPAASLACAASNAAAGEARVQERSGNEGSRLAVVAVTLADATIVTPPALATVTFNGLGRVVANADGSASITQVDASNPEGTRPLRVMLGAAGTVRMCDPSPLLAANDPRHC